MELARCLLAGRPPRGDQGAVLREAVHPAVPVSVRDIEIAGRGGDHLGGLVERPGRARGKLDVLGRPRVRRLAARAEDHQGLAVQRELEGDVVVAIGQIDHVVDDGDPVWVPDGAVTPRGQIFAVAIEHDDRWILSLEGVDAVLRVGRDRTDLSPRPAGWQPRPGFVQLVLVAAASNGRRHGHSSSESWSGRSCAVPPVGASLRLAYDSALLSGAVGGAALLIRRRTLAPVAAPQLTLQQESIRAIKGLIDRIPVLSTPPPAR